jgi:hypothetical protein
MLYVSAGGVRPELDVVGIGDGDNSVTGDADDAAAALYGKLGNFRLDGAHCYDPNEVRMWWVRVQVGVGAPCIELTPRNWAWVGGVWLLAGGFSHRSGACGRPSRRRQEGFWRSSNPSVRFPLAIWPSPEAHRRRGWWIPAVRFQPRRHGCHGDATAPTARRL